MQPGGQIVIHVTPPQDDIARIVVRAQEHALYLEMLRRLGQLQSIPKLEVN